MRLFDGEYPPNFKKRILIDPGHGCDDAGASGVLGPEKESNWQLSNTIVEHLNATGKYRASLTRKSLDAGCTNGGNAWRRGRLANRKRADAFISIHADGPASDLEGSWIIWSNQRMAQKSWKDNRLLADLLGTSLDHSGFETFHMTAHYSEGTTSSAKYLTTNDRYGVHIDNTKQLGVLRNTTAPAVLIETHWLQNEDEAVLFAQDETQQRYAAAIERGLQSFFMAKDGVYSPEVPPEE